MDFIRLVITRVPSGSSGDLILWPVRVPKDRHILPSSGKQLYQLPVSYFTAANKWANSPLYPTYPVIFNRPITSRCLECHSTFAQVTSEPHFEPEEFDNRIIYGVDCEKCHGPGARHVLFQTQNPSEKKAKYILNPAAYSRQQKLIYVHCVTAEDCKKQSLLLSLYPATNYPIILKWILPPRILII